MILDVVFDEQTEELQADFGEVSVIRTGGGNPGDGFVKTVNGIAPDRNGNVEVPTPQKGVDYWTPDDIAEIKSYVDEAILGGAW